MLAPVPPGSSPADLLALGLGGGQEDAAFERDVDLGEFLCTVPDLELQGCLGRGGMGVVYRARQVRLERDVAVKLMSPEVARDPEFAERFAREAKAMARLHHPGIVGVHDFGQAAGVYYIVMELVDGPNLRELMAQPMTDVQASEIVGQLCDALAYAHAQGVVHRDIKPENVLLDRAGQVRIADFGLAKLQREPQHGAATRTRRVLGTPQYMAPEQIRDPGSVDHRSDIFAIGVVFYEMLTGQLPVGRFPAPSEFGQGDARLDEIVLRALESNRDRRFQAASEIRAALSTMAQDDTRAESIAPARRPWTLVAWASGGVAVAAAVGLTWQLGATPPDPPQGSEPAALAEPEALEAAAPAIHRDRWPGRELGILDPSVVGVVGVDWSELRQAPAIARLGSAAFGGDATLAELCHTGIINRTHKVLVGFASDGNPVDAIVHADWDLDALERCLKVAGPSFHTKADAMPLTWHSEAFGPYRRLRLQTSKSDRTVTIGKRGSTVVLTLRPVTVPQLDAMLNGDVTSGALRERVEQAVDLRAPIWLFAAPDPDLLPLKMTAFHGTVDVWEQLTVDATLAFADDASAASAKTLIESYANVIASIPDLGAAPEVTVEHEGTRVRARATLVVPALDLDKGQFDISVNVEP